MNWLQILDQAGNIAIGLFLLFVGLPIFVLTLTFFGKLLAYIIALPIGLTIVGAQKLYKWLITPKVIKVQSLELPPVEYQPTPVITLAGTENRTIVRRVDLTTTYEAAVQQQDDTNQTHHYIPPEYEPPVEKSVDQLPFDAGEMFTGELVGKRLRLVCGIQTVGKKCSSEDWGEPIWLVFESDSPDKLIWTSPQWRYFGANAGFQLSSESRLVAIGKTPLKLQANEIVAALPQWQALIGMQVVEVRKDSISNHVSSPLALIFAPIENSSIDPERKRPSIGFDSEDLDEPYIFGIGGLEDDSCHWALSEEVQFYLNLGHTDWATMPVWSTPRNTPPPPWNDKNHLDTLIQLRRLLQDTVIWLSTYVFLPVPYGDIERHLNYLWTALDELSAFEIALTRRRHYVKNNPSWLDRDGESYGSAWESMGEFEVALKAADLQITQSKWHHGLLEIERANVFQKHESLLLAAYGNESAFAEIEMRYHERMRLLELGYKAWDEIFCNLSHKVKFSVKEGNVVHHEVVEPDTSILSIEFIEEVGAPYGFLVVPVDKSSFQGTSACMHLDTPYVRMTISALGRYIMYLFDKNRRHITWAERAKELENFPVEEKDFGDGYKVERRREVKFIPESLNDGREFLVDVLYFEGVYQYGKTEVEITPIETAYEKYLEIRKSQDDYKLRRASNEAKYLSPDTSSIERQDILFEEVACEVAMYTYHPMLREGDEMAVFTQYSTYLGKYFSKVEEPENTYIDYLQAYCYGLRETAAGDLEGDEEIEFIKNKCKEAELMHIFYKRFSNLKKS